MPHIRFIIVALMLFVSACGQQKAEGIENVFIGKWSDVSSDNGKKLDIRRGLAGFVIEESYADRFSEGKRTSDIRLAFIANGVMWVHKDFNGPERMIVVDASGKLMCSDLPSTVFARVTN